MDAYIKLVKFAYKFFAICMASVTDTAKSNLMDTNAWALYSSISDSRTHKQISKGTKNVNNSSLCFFVWLLLRPVRCLWMLRWSSDGSILLRLAESQMEITTQLDVICCWFHYILWCVSSSHYLAVFQFDMSCGPSLCGSPPPLNLHPYKSTCGIAKIYISWWANQLALYRRVTLATEGPWIAVK